jgi:hypothetical protein
VPSFFDLNEQQTNGIFELEVTNASDEKAIWTVDLKKTASVYKGKAQPKADVTIILSDETLVDLADGKVSTIKLFTCRSTHILVRVDYGSESIYDWKVEDEGEHDARYEA